MALLEGFSGFKFHLPVMYREILAAFESSKDKTSQNEKVRYFDGTFGRGGHYHLLREHLGENMSAFVCDQDVAAVAFANETFKTEVEAGRLKIHHGNYSDVCEADIGEFDMILLDLGVSSPQLDEAARGFSFQHDGPLDMRMNQQQEYTAADIINQATEQELIDIFKDLGEVRSPFRVVRAIVNDRKITPYQTTRELASLVERVEGWTKKGFHPATQYFMALRLQVNRELDHLKFALPELMKKLTPGGRMAVLSFHSLEDRIVKNIFKESTIGEQTHKKVLVALDDETKTNPRARSAKLRIFEAFDKAGTDNVASAEKDERSAYWDKKSKRKGMK